MNTDSVIFDFDGTLVDSEDNYYLADKILVEYLAGKEKFSPIPDEVIRNYTEAFFRNGLNISESDNIIKPHITFTKQDKTEFIGLDGKEVIRRIQNKFHLPGTTEELLQLKNNLYIRIAIQHTIVYPKMLTLVQKLHKAGIKLAVASGTYNDNLTKLLKATNLLQYFQVIIGGDDVSFGKPNPDIFLLACQRLESTPQKCFVAEDSLHGVQAALNAGMHLIAVPYLLHEKYPDDFYKADLLSPGGMETFNPEEAFCVITGAKNDKI